MTAWIDTFMTLPVFWQLLISFLATMYVLMAVMALSDRRRSGEEIRRRLAGLRRKRPDGAREAQPEADGHHDEAAGKKQPGQRSGKGDESDLIGTGMVSRLARKIRRADLKFRAGEFLLLQAAGAVGGALVMQLLTGHLFGAMVGSLIGLWSPHIYLQRRYQQRLKTFNDQLPDALQLLSNALKSGYSFMQAADVIAREMPDPIAGEFAQVVRETRVNIALEDALANLLDRVESSDLDLVVTAVLIQNQVGGNMAEVLETIGHTIRDRIRILGQIRTLTTQGRMSGWIIALLPLALMLVLSLMNPTYMTPLVSHPLGWAMLGFGALLQAMGLAAIRKIVQVEV
ncbi:MAG: type II secretion system F family protein [Thermaerobacterales bacterium]